MADIANPDSDSLFVNAIETARKTIAVIHQHGINKIILLSHLGYDGDIALAEQVSGISVIVQGISMYYKVISQPLASAVKMNMA